jgi:hypothetical protein
MQQHNRRYRSLMKQHKHVEATPETRCVENLQLQEKKQQMTVSHALKGKT